MTARALLIHPLDNVAVALEDIAQNSVVSISTASAGHSLLATESIPFAHKIAIKPIANGDLVMKYGTPVGCATAEIEPGAWVHTHNAQSRYVRLTGKSL